LRFSKKGGDMKRMRTDEAEAKMLKQIIRRSKRPHSPRLESDQEVFDPTFLRLGLEWKKFDFNGTLRGTCAIQQTTGAINEAASCDRLNLSKFFLTQKDEHRVHMHVDEDYLLEYGRKSIEHKFVVHYNCSVCQKDVTLQITRCFLCKFCRKTLFCSECNNHKRPDMPCSYCIPELILLRMPERLTSGTKFNDGSLRVESLRQHFENIFVRCLQQRPAHVWKGRVFSGK